MTPCDIEMKDATDVTLRHHMPNFEKPSCNSFLIILRARFYTDQPPVTLKFRSQSPKVATVEIIKLGVKHHIIKLQKVH